MGNSCSGAVQEIMDLDEKLLQHRSLSIEGSFFRAHLSAPEPGSVHRVSIGLLLTLLPCPAQGLAMLGQPWHRLTQWPLLPDLGVGVSDHKLVGGNRHHLQKSYLTGILTSI